MDAKLAMIIGNLSRVVRNLSIYKSSFNPFSEREGTKCHMIEYENRRAGKRCYPAGWYGCKQMNDEIYKCECVKHTQNSSTCLSSISYDDFNVPKCLWGCRCARFATYTIQKVISIWSFGISFFPGSTFCSAFYEIQYLWMALIKFASTKIRKTSISTVKLIKSWWLELSMYRT